jgi:hypothetical protein
MHAFVRVCQRACIYADETLISMLACVDGWQEGQTPLHYASQNGCLEMVEALLAKGADVEAKDKVSITRTCALEGSVHRAHSRACRTRMATARGCT